MYKHLTFFLALVLCTPLLHASDEDAVLTPTKITALHTHVFGGRDVDVNGKHHDFFYQGHCPSCPALGPRYGRSTQPHG